ncbi:hypothetical protein EDB83DRAFT_371226 [Lactarius deliciosus]|nr:hypothetical protein EDB83DRAFT_371226 [Lactarius deliciosus]
MLSDDILLGIFRHRLDLTPKFWPTLACVCRRWRKTVFGSPLGLNLRLYCTYGTPVLKTLDFWPPLPLVLNYGGSPILHPPALEDNDNIITALRQSDRVSSISLTVTHSLLESLSTISKAFSELEELALVSGDNVPLTLSSTFRWGPPPPYPSLDQDCLSLIAATTFSLPRPRRYSAPRNSQCWVFFPTSVREFLVRDDPSSNTFTPFPFPPTSPKLPPLASTISGTGCSPCPHVPQISRNQQVLGQSCGQNQCTWSRGY